MEVKRPISDGRPTSRLLAKESTSNRTNSADKYFKEKTLNTFKNTLTDEMKPTKFGAQHFDVVVAEIQNLEVSKVMKQFSWEVPQHIPSQLQHI